mgnify:CR=1 FL=1
MDIQLEKKKGFQKKHIPYVAGGAFFLILVGSRFDIESGCPRCQYRECDERAI